MLEFVHLQSYKTVEGTAFFEGNQVCEYDLCQRGDTTSPYSLNSYRLIVPQKISKVSRGEVNQYTYFDQLLEHSWKVLRRTLRYLLRREEFARASLFSDQTPEQRAIRLRI